jgi:hypothetical protein
MLLEGRTETRLARSIIREEWWRGKVRFLRVGIAIKIEHIYNGFWIATVDRSEKHEVDKTL